MKKALDIKIIKEEYESVFKDVLIDYLNNGYEPYLGKVEIKELYTSNNYITVLVKYEKKEEEENF